LALAKFPDKTQEQVANHVGCDRAYVSKVASELVNSHKLKLPTTRKGKDGKERRLEHDTFEDYCQEKWGWKRQRAYEMIAAADAVKSLPDECSKNITNDSQAREVAKARSPSTIVDVSCGSAKNRKPRAARQRGCDVEPVFSTSCSLSRFLLHH
jgi:hypothetical protein